MYSQENASDSALLVQLQDWGLTVLWKRDSVLEAFCKIFEVLQKLIFTEDGRATASDFQQHFRHITCSISNKINELSHSWRTV